MIKSHFHGESVLDYDSESLEEYSTMWDLPLGLGEMAINDTRKVEGGVFSIAAVPFATGVDAIFDHPKYFAVSHESFPVPQNGSLEFSVDIKASTPGTQPGREIHGSYMDTPNGGRPYAQYTIEAQQAAVMFNMKNEETGQVFDWFVSGSSAFAMIGRLPSSVTQPTLLPSDPNYVGLARMYTQIIQSAALKPGETHTFAIRYTRTVTDSLVEYFLDGNHFAHVDDVGIPLDTQGAPYKRVYPSYHKIGAVTPPDGPQSAPGEQLKSRLDTFRIGHGLFSMLDAFPFQHPDAPDQAVSIPVSERLFGQGAVGEFSKFVVTTVSN